MKLHLLSILILIAVSIALYVNTLTNGFVYDDKKSIEDNILIQSFNNLPLLFDKSVYFSDSKEMSYRPIVTFTYFIDHAIYGFKPFGYHLTNVFIHTLNGIFLYCFLYLLLSSELLKRSIAILLSFIISLLFLSHPVLTEVVNGISFREDMLVFLFYINTISLYLILRIKPITNRRPSIIMLLYLISCFTYVFALFSKEMAVTLVLIVICYEWLCGEKNVNLLQRLFNRYCIGYIIITIFYLYIRFYLFYNPKEQIMGWCLVERFLTMPWLVMSYIKLSFFPINLSAHYMIKPITSYSLPIFILSLIVLLYMFISITFTGTIKKIVFFGALFFLISLIPVYNLVPIFNPFAERYLYLPVAGLTMFVVLLFYQVIETYNQKKITLNVWKIDWLTGDIKALNIFIIIFTIALLNSILIIKRNAVWKDSYSLWSDTVIKMPDSSLAHNNLGLAYVDMRSLDKAITEYRKAIKLKFDYTIAHYNLATAYVIKGQYTEAVYELETGLRFEEDANAHHLLGIIYSRQERLDDAAKEFLTALRLNPSDVEAHNDLGSIYFKQGRNEDAIYEFSKTLKK